MMKLMNTKSYRLASLLGFALLGATLSGCGPNLVADEASPNEMGVNGYYYGQSGDANYTCPSAENITPPDDRIMDGTQRYTACAAKTSTTKVKITGYSSSSRMLCAFPVQYINSTQFIYKLDQYYQPMYTCYDSLANADTTVQLDFPATNYNGIAIVDQDLRPQMSTCLMTGGPCPMHAIGQFR
jgi:hypothetical protein